MEIRAAVLDRMEQPRPYTQTRPVSVETIQLAGPGPGEVLVRITGAGLCHSDLSIVNGNRPRPMPMVLRCRKSRRECMIPLTGRR